LRRRADSPSSEPGLTAMFFQLEAG
jgi:hypothetical protein